MAYLYNMKNFFSLPKLILYADDDEDDRELIDKAIKNITPGYEVLHAVNGIDALSKLEQLKAEDRLPCLIILDMNMPGMGGKETLAELKNDENYKHIPTVIFTTSEARIYEDIALRYQIEVVTKPAKYQGIIDHVRRLLTYCE
jgi:CheY-like chemotaxis protein